MRKSLESVKTHRVVVFLPLKIPWNFPQRSFPQLLPNLSYTENVLKVEVGSKSKVIRDLQSDLRSNSTAVTKFYDELLAVGRGALPVWIDANLSQFPVSTEWRASQHVWLAVDKGSLRAVLVQVR